MSLSKISEKGLTYAPVNKAGDTMTGTLAAPTVVAVNNSNPTSWVATDVNNLLGGSAYNQFNTTNSIAYSGTYSDHPYALVTNNAARMHISTNGNVGIGTSSPTSQISFGANVGKTVAVFENAGGNNIYGIGMGGGGTVADPYRTKIFANGFEALNVDYAGRVTMPYQACFSAHANGGTNPGSNQTLPFQVVTLNTGNHYNASISTFTAPINGTYFFYFQALGDASANARVIAYIQKNGAGIVEGSATTKDYNSVQAQVIVSLSAGDNIRIQTDGGPEGTRFYGYSNIQNWFMGYLIG